MELPAGGQAVCDGPVTFAGTGPVHAADQPRFPRSEADVAFRAGRRHVARSRCPETAGLTRAQASLLESHFGTGVLMALKPIGRLHAIMLGAATLAATACSKK